MKISIENFSDKKILYKKKNIFKTFLNYFDYTLMPNNLPNCLFLFSEPRNVTGTTESYLFWNKIGRQRVLQLIESKLEY